MTDRHEGHIEVKFYYFLYINIFIFLDLGLRHGQLPVELVVLVQLPGLKLLQVEQIVMSLSTGSPIFLVGFKKYPLS